MTGQTILLVNPGHREWARVLPLGIAYVAAAARKAGFPVRTIDATAERLSPQALALRLKKLKPAVLGITATTVQIASAWEIARLAKEHDPGCVTVLGGVHPSALPEESLGQPSVDFVCRGEGEATFVSLLSALSSRTHPGSVQGISFRSNGSVVHTPDRRLVPDPDLFAFPARELFDFPRRYQSPLALRRRCATILTSRGCPGTCTFCNKNISGSVFRPRSPASVIEEMESLIRTFGIQEFHIADDCFSWDMQRVMDLCALMRKRIPAIRWACTNGIRVDRSTKPFFREMKAAGCYRVSFGVESGDEALLKRIGKNIDQESIRRAVSLAQSAGLVTICFFMLGNHGETAAHAQKTIEFARSLRTDYAQFTLAMPYPGTAFFRQLEKEGRIRSRDWRRYSVYGPDIPYEPAGMSAEELLGFYRQAYRAFYLRPRQIAFLLSRRLRLGAGIGSFVRSSAEVLRRAR